MVEGADFVTLVNALLGATAVLSLIAPLPGGLSPASVFILLVTLGLVFDGLDGLVARRYGMSAAGRMLDSFSDAITFGLAPAAFVLHQLDAALLLLPAVLVFVGCTIYRLAQFTTLESERTVFNGLPSPVAGIVLLLAAVLPVRWHFAFALALLLGALMVSGIAYPKIRGPYQPALVVFALLALLHLGLYFVVPGWRSLVVASGIGISVAVVLGAPFLVDDAEEE